MNKITVLIIAFVLTLGAKAEKWRLYYLGGQSNMVGFGYSHDIKASDYEDLKDVRIFHAEQKLNGSQEFGDGAWEKMKVGHGTGYQFSEGKSKFSNRFGAELSFAKRLKELYPNDKIAIIKYAMGGSGIDSADVIRNWHPDYQKTTNQFDYFVTTVNNALSVKDIDGDGTKDELIPCGFAWMQGETDAQKTKLVAEKYLDNISYLMSKIRSHLGNDSLDLVIGKITGGHEYSGYHQWKFGDVVQNAMEEFVKQDPNAMIVRETMNYKYSDCCHYRSKDYIDMGIQFAHRLYMLDKNLKSKHQIPKNTWLRKDRTFIEYDIKEFKFAGRDAKIVFPHFHNWGPKKWVLRARFFGHEPQLDKALLKAGYHIAYIDVSNLYGNHEAIKIWDDFYEYLVQNYTFYRKVVLEGMSRGGLIVYNWAVKNLDKVSVIYADAPVMDFRSWPGGQNGKFSKVDWERCKKAYGVNENQARTYKNIPVNYAKQFAKSDVSIIHVCGLNDMVVPYKENTEVFATQLKKLGANIKLINKEDCGHHPHSLKDPKEIFDFIIKNYK
jgi:pimeloyl-ACP methyl ester carboxylesterase